MNVEIHERFEYIDYGIVGQRVESIAVAIRHILGLSSSSTVGLCSLNRREWLLTDYAVSRCSMVSVPLYPTLSADAISYIAKHAELEMVATDIATVPHIVEVAGNCPALKFSVEICEMLENLRSTF